MIRGVGGGRREVEEKGLDDKTSSPSCASILGLKPAMSLITPRPSGTTFYTYAHCTAALYTTELYSSEGSR